VLVNGSKGAGLVIPIATASDQAGKPIRLLGGLPQAITITPDGKTLYVTNYRSGTVLLISTATDTQKLIRVGKGPVAVAFTPDGKTAYVVSVGASTVTPISTATNTPGRPIKAGPHPFAIAITP
jgi:YVTN family beta-propeller protein